jgi:A/G-specific adenine glycosylase
MSLLEFDFMSPPARKRLAPTTIPHFRKRLLSWFDQNKRDLPWRENRDPYRVWLSEIMLQQTRVAAVIDYYQRFLKKFPNIQKLAAAREASVLAAWSGLGYYRRARMLHAAAKQIVKEYDGQFPSTVEELRRLSGVGRYTSAAIASISFDQPVAVVDGNVARVIQRLYGKRFADETIWQKATNLLSAKRPGDFNQAMMELGATVCTPRQPSCLLCPVRLFCVSRGEIKYGEKKATQRKREIFYALHRRNGKIFLMQRAHTASLMPGMWELPEITNPNGAEVCLTLKHSITVTDYTVRVLENVTLQDSRGQWVVQSRVDRIPLTGLTRKILKASGLLR